MASWHLAPCLQILLTQINTAYPKRDKRSDGTLGNARHRRTKSDHNPDPDNHSVNALDVTHGPYWHRPVLDVHQLVNELVASRDPRIEYIIFERRIWERETGRWRHYDGLSPHLEHFHISVRHGNQYENDTRYWNCPSLRGILSPPPPPPPPPAPKNDFADAILFTLHLAKLHTFVPFGNNDPKAVAILQHLLNEKFKDLPGHIVLKENGLYDVETIKVVKYAQLLAKQEPDGITDRELWDWVFPF